jgi:mono/diheme cytochrome c family protein
MLFFGEAAPRNRPEAHRWFHAAAEKGHARAQQNLAVMHYLGAGVPQDPEEAERYFRLARASADAGRLLRGSASVAELVERGGAAVKGEERPGETGYATFCAGCHGLNGVAAYVNSPSFAIGERLERSETALRRSIVHGLGEMPEWGNKLPPRDLLDILRFVQSFPAMHELGILQDLRRPPDLYFLFGPMRQNPSAYQPMDEDDVERAIGRRGR